MPLEGLQDKVAVVTGAGGDIGAGVALRLSQEGMKVVLVDLDREAAERAAHALPGASLVVGADVSDERDVDAYTAAAVERFGRLDAAHLNAGYAGALMPVIDSDPADFDQIIAVNVRGVYLGLRAAMRRFREQGGGGTIAVTSSGLGVRGGQMLAPYSASKHAVLGLMRSAALEGARDGVRVNAICPGVIDTAMMRRTEDAFGAGDRAAARAVLENTIPVGRYGRPAETAACVAWLLSDESSYCTGGYFTVDGGVDAAAAGYMAPAG
jgi:NAD(P)-dependent dehydrogenase (short-subunit alcohol dehydrogenase family)